MNFDKENFKKPSLDHLQFRIGELARMTNISTRQLRYWEKQESRLYGFRAFIKVAIIKQNLDDGDSLHDAVDKANEQLESAMIIHHIMKKAFQGIEEYEGRVVVNLGYFDDDETQLLYVYLESGKVKYRVVDKRESPITRKSQLL